MLCMVLGCWDPESHMLCPQMSTSLTLMASTLATPPPLILFLPPTLSYRVNLMCVSMCVIPEVTQRVSSVLSFLRIPHPHPRCLLELHLITCATLTRSAVQGGIAITAGRVWNLGLGIWIWES